MCAHHDRLSVAGAREWRQDDCDGPAHDADRAQCRPYIPVRSGGDIGVFNGMLHVMIERGWINREFIAQHTTGWEQVEEAVAKIYA